MAEKQYLYGKVDYSSLVKARNFLAEILQNARNDYEKTGTVKAFEFLLKFHGVEADNARDVFREAAKLNLLADAENKKPLNMLQMETRHQAIVQQILSKYPYQFYAYGSRVKGEAKKCSDLDLCYQEEIPWNVLSHIREDFTNSNLPFKVDLIF
ncbi:26234_t:CDS:2 [Gigaspora margarita]|uniref:26234_t:CDS:1 n=1 Tax=Gigaspora margarita TaxID=4874 RepID=A0ABM8VVC8_GIGMA|nr:26234_t:CDS:2 [Gigaspora margarita]